MKLEQRLINVNRVELGNEAKVENGVLTVDVEGLRAALMDDDKIKDVKVDVCHPGDRTRIVPVKDVIEPRYRIGRKNGFPGVTTKYEEAGNGATAILKGAAVITIGDMVGFQEGVIDMWGEGATWTPFSKTCNIVVDITPIDGIDQHTHERVVRMAGLKAATFVGLAAKDAEPDEVKVLELGTMAEETEKYPDLPKVAMMEMTISQGLLHDTFYYGVDLKEILPTWYHPFTELDDAVISGNCVAACDKITTYQHQNNTMIDRLYEQHGKTINYIGNIWAPELTTLDGKFRNCDYAAQVAHQLGCDGVIITEEGYGNPDSDLVMNCKRLEDRGIKTTLVTDECSGWDGTSQPLTDNTKEAVAVVSTGNVSMVVELEPADKVIGNLKSAQTLAGGWDGCAAEDGSLKVELNAVIGATSEIGFHNSSVQLY